MEQKKDALTPEEAVALARGRGHGGVELTAGEASEVGANLPPAVKVLHETVRVQGELEMSRSVAALAWSSLAAGLSMGFSALVPALLQSQLPSGPGWHLLSTLGYTIGFLIVVLARQQLFTENTITAVLPLLSRPGWESTRRLLRLWGIVLLGNLAGCAVFALGLAWLPVMDADARHALGEAGLRLMAHSGQAMFVQAILAGWLIAMMVWLVAAAEAAKTLMIILMTFLVGVGGFPHIVVGSIEAFFLVFDGQLSLAVAVTHFALPALAGNIVGGSLVFALVSHAQVRSAS